MTIWHSRSRDRAADSKFSTAYTQLYQTLSVVEKPARNTPERRPPKSCRGVLIIPAGRGTPSGRTHTAGQARQTTGTTPVPRLRRRIDASSKAPLNGRATPARGSEGEEEEEAGHPRRECQRVEPRSTAL